MKRRPRKGEMYPVVGDVISLIVRDGIRCAGVTLAVNPPAIATCFVLHTFPANALPDYSKIFPDAALEVKMHGPLGFNDSWVIHGPLPDFRSSDWPPLVFYQQYLRRAVRYDEETLDFNGVQVVETGENVNGWPEDGPGGDVYVQQVLARKLVQRGALD